MSDHSTIVCTIWLSAKVSAGTLLRFSSIRKNTKAALIAPASSNRKIRYWLASAAINLSTKGARSGTNRSRSGTSQFLPVVEEKEHQVHTKFRVGLGHLVPGQHRHRLHRALDRGKRRIIHTKDDRRDGPPPTRK